MEAVDGVHILNSLCLIDLKTIVQNIAYINFSSVLIISQYTHPSYFYLLFIQCIIKDCVKEFKQRTNMMIGYFRINLV